VADFRQNPRQYEPWVNRFRVRVAVLVHCQALILPKSKLQRTLILITSCYTNRHERSSCSSADANFPRINGITSSQWSCARCRWASASDSKRRRTLLYHLASPYIIVPNTQQITFQLRASSHKLFSRSHGVPMLRPAALGLSELVDSIHTSLPDQTFWTFIVHSNLDPSFVLSGKGSCGQSDSVCSTFMLA
jgi:hypothetical protein